MPVGSPEHSAMKQHLEILAAYHAWAFGVLYAALRSLDDAAYRADCGLFFRSIHRTLNHLLLADRVWFGRVVGEPYVVPGLDHEIETDRQRLERAIHEAAARWSVWLAARDASELEAVLAYVNFAGARFEQPLGLLLLHVFNHGTHHRGQISAAVSRLGLTVPEMDLILYLRRA
jgi:uncharacterized damage-inducible protein DinB